MREKGEIRYYNGRGCRIFIPCDETEMRIYGQSDLIRIYAIQLHQFRQKSIFAHMLRIHSNLRSVGPVKLYRAAPQREKKKK